MTPATSKPRPKHPPVPSLPRKPLLRLEIRDLSSKASLAFLSLPSSGSILQNAVEATLAWLYTPSSTIPPTRSITLILRDMPGVAYTTGSDIDSDHKEIHFSTSYIEGQMHKGGFEKEVLGVITHEMVHCWQWDARGTCPGGLIEGIADFVRLRAGFVPGHWKKEAGGEWDAGYQHTGYFLDYLERRFGDGMVVKINETLRDRVYKEKRFWEECCGCGVEELWEEYGRYLKKEKEREEDGHVSEESFEIVEAVDDNNDEEDEHEHKHALTEQQSRGRMMEAQREAQAQDVERRDSSPFYFGRSEEGKTKISDHQQNEKRKRGIDVTAEEIDHLGVSDTARQQQQEWQHDQTQIVLQERAPSERARKEAAAEAEQEKGPALAGHRERLALLEKKVGEEVAEGRAQSEHQEFTGYQESLRLLEKGNGRREKKVKEEDDEAVDATNPFL
ncbi:hypothetical protein BLS_005299 [Venturia inaequalis]|uniref:Uncharacterized protein n=1 Tax=Venturia inaequalis TaxID=5025 RepID=A0A8H3UFD7_VENIN|nr:hypothetical protein BLS_005299 [Venturia inaequalis]